MLLYSRRILRGSILWIVNIYHFAGLIFADLRTCTQYVLYNWTYFADYFVLVDNCLRKPWDWDPQKFPAIWYIHAQRDPGWTLHLYVRLQMQALYTCTFIVRDIQRSDCHVPEDEVYIGWMYLLSEISAGIGIGFLETEQWLRLYSSWSGTTLIHLCLQHNCIGREFSLIETTFLMNLLGH